MKVSIVSPEKTLFCNEDVECVFLPGELGAFEVLKNHAPLVSMLTGGNVVCRGKEDFTLPISGGFVEVANNEISICVEV